MSLCAKTVSSIFKIIFSSKIGEPKNFPKCTILDSWIYDNFVLADE